MKCPVQSGENAEILLDYCARKLDWDSAALLEEHMKECPDCRAFRDAQSALWSGLDEWKSFPVSTDFNRRLFARIDAEEEKPWWQQWRSIIAAFTVEPAMPFAAAALAMAAFWFQAITPTPAIPQPVVAHAEMRADTFDMEQVARELEDIDMLNALPSVIAFEDGQPGKSI